MIRKVTIDALLFLSIQHPHPTLALRIRNKIISALSSWLLKFEQSTLGNRVRPFSRLA